MNPLKHIQDDPPYTLSDGEVTIYTTSRAAADRIMALWNDTLGLETFDIQQGQISLALAA